MRCLHRMIDLTLVLASATGQVLILTLVLCAIVLCLLIRVSLLVGYLCLHSV